MSQQSTGTWPAADTRLFLLCLGIGDLHVDRLSPLINHRKRDSAPAEWIDRARFRMAVRAAVARYLTQILQTDIYQAWVRRSSTRD